MINNEQTMTRLMMTGAIIAAFTLSGCADIVYSWYIPDNGDCPTGTVFMASTPGSPDLDGGPGIVDRDGGTGIVDREEKFVTDYCLRGCVGSEQPTGAPIVDWHNPGKYVVAYRRCRSSNDGT